MYIIIYTNRIDFYLFIYHKLKQSSKNFYFIDFDIKINRIIQKHKDCINTKEKVCSK